MGADRDASRATDYAGEDRCHVAGFTMVVASLHLLYVNTRLLPPHIRPPMWRRVALMMVALFYGTFSGFAFFSL